MAKNRKSTKHNPLAGTHNLALVQAMQGKASGAGVHADQKSRVHRVGQTNRVGSRSARRRVACNDGW